MRLVWKVRFIAFSVLSLLCVVTTTLFAAEPNSLPRDLQQLLHLWEKVPKVSEHGIDTWKVEAVTLEENQQLNLATLARTALESAE